MRRLAAILAADAVGYSRLMGADDAATVAALKAHRGAMAGRIHAHVGRVVAPLAGGSLGLPLPRRHWHQPLHGRPLRRGRSRSSSQPRAPPWKHRALAQLAAALEHLGRHEEARAVLDDLRGVGPGLRVDFLRLVPSDAVVARVLEGWRKAGWVEEPRE